MKSLKPSQLLDVELMQRVEKDITKKRVPMFNNVVEALEHIDEEIKKYNETYERA